jgi:Spy/CpxP family protein refolding chaperone
MASRNFTPQPSSLTPQIQRTRNIRGTLMPMVSVSLTLKETRMKSVFKPALLAGLLAGSTLFAFAQAPGAGPGPGGPMMGPGGPMMHEGMGHPGMGKMDPARRQAMAERRQAQLKEKLKLTPAQEGAWTTFTAAIKMPADMLAKRPDFAELAKLPTPERIDKMQALHAQHASEMNAAMEKRGAATKVFYATLTPEQQKVFDVSTPPHHGEAGRRGGPRNGKGPVQPQK